MVSFHDEYDYLIHLVRCTIHDQTPSELPDGVIFDSVYKCGVSHGVANIAYHSLEKLEIKPEEELYSKWRANKDSSIIRDMNQSFAREEIIGRFRDEGIRSIEVQGTRLKEFYPKPEYRTMSDIDFIIEPKNLDVAERVLEGLGYKCRNTTGVEVDGFRQPHMIVEVHTEFFPVDSDYHSVMGDPFESAVGLAGEACVVSDEVLYTYSVLHIAKHYFREGCGIRRILDMYLLNRHFPHICERECVNKVFCEAGITEFVCDVSELAECWFGAAASVPSERLSEMVSTVKAAGIHGTVEKRLSNQFSKEKDKGTKNIKVRYVWKRLFPEKRVLLVNYPVLERHPVLTPFCWCHRLFGAVTKKRKRISREVRTVRETKIDK